MNLLKSLGRVQQKLPLTVIAAAVAGSLSIGRAVEYDLSASGSQSLSVHADVGGNAVFSDYFTQPAGTGVFEPFLTIEANAAGKPPTNNKYIEQGFNTDGFSHLYFDQQRPQWNKLLRLGDLAPITVGTGTYYGFLLDANEPGGGKSVISIDNIRIYTSATDQTASVHNKTGDLDNLGVLRWAMNDPLKNGNNFNIDDWVKLDSNQENVEAGDNVSNGGSGKSDMIVYIPTTAFAGANADDFVWFYNLNGVHYSAEPDLATQAGYEEWRAIMAIHDVPEGGLTLALLGFGMLGLGALRRARS